MECEHTLSPGEGGMAYCTKCGRKAACATPDILLMRVKAGFQMSFHPAVVPAPLFQVYCTVCGAYFGHEIEWAARRLYNYHWREIHGGELEVLEEGVITPSAIRKSEFDNVALRALLPIVEGIKTGYITAKDFSSRVISATGDLKEEEIFTFRVLYRQKESG